MSLNIKNPNPLYFALTLALIIVLTVFLISCLATGGHLGIYEADTPIYLQYAKQIAQGHPYSFFLGDSPSTGSTTHLFPFVLSIPYLLGFTGNTYLCVVFFLNALFYLFILFLVWLIAKKLYPPATPLALLLTTLSGHTVAATLHMTDMGFFSVLALGLFVSVLYKRKKVHLYWLFSVVSLALKGWFLEFHS